MIELLIYTALWIWGVNFAFKPGQIFGSAGLDIESTLPRWAYKMLIGCCPCMSSLWGTSSFFGFYHLFGISPFIYPFFVVCLIGLNHIITAFIYDLD